MLSKTYVHSDLKLNRISEEDCAEILVNVLMETFINLFNDNQLLCILNGIVTTDVVHRRVY